MTLCFLLFRTFSKKSWVWTDDLFLIVVVYMNRFFRASFNENCWLLGACSFFVGGVGLACQGLPYPISISW